MKNFFQTLALALSLCLFLPRPFQGAEGVGNNNPTGVTGEYNGSVTTGGSYDPYTGNAKRFIDDLTVTGSLGAYPLKWTRILNTRNTSPCTHNYQWGLWLRTYEYYHFHDPPYAIEAPGGQVTYPDGRILTFAQPQQPNVWFVDPSIAEVQDRLVPVPGEMGNFYLLMRDGGKVKFVRTDNNPNAETLHFIATQITDPYGLTTLLKRDSAG